MNLSARVTHIDHTRIFTGRNLDHLKKFLCDHHLINRKIFILTDHNTRKYCLPIVIAHISELNNADILEVPSGETSKSLQQASLLWEELSKKLADRNSLLINLGGGMITDLGGFIAAGFMRGIPYINLPTTLIAQVDASIGGKTAINLNSIKNQVGFFYAPLAVFILSDFLITLPEQHIKSGLAEILKMAIIGDPKLYRCLLQKKIMEWIQIPVTDKKWTDIIQKSIIIKNRIIRDDYTEKNRRKILNFGHTFGHAFESLSQGKEKQRLMHGEAVALGMICETFLSSLKSSLPLTERDVFVNYLRESFSCSFFRMDDFPFIMELLKHDKKNKERIIRFTLIDRLGSAKINIVCTEEEIVQAYRFFLNLND